MLTLFTVIAVAVLIAFVAKTEGAKPFALVVVGLLCMVLGGRAAMVLTQNSISPILASHVMAQESAAPDELVVEDEAQPDPEVPLPDAIETNGEEESPATDEAEAKEESPAETSAAGDAEITTSDEAAPLAEAADPPGPDSLAPETEDDEQPVRFITSVEYLTPNRPDWLELKPITEGDVHYVAVMAGPYSKPRDCHRELDNEIRLATKEYIDDFVGTQGASALITYHLGDIKQRLVQGEVFEEKLSTSVGIMRQVHARLKFDRDFRNQLDDRWARIRAGSRLVQTGMGASIVLLLVTILFSYFRLDTATKGYYTGRLQFTAAGAILTLVVASVLLAKWIPWM